MPPMYVYSAYAATAPTTTAAIRIRDRRELTPTSSSSDLPQGRREPYPALSVVEGDTSEGAEWPIRPPLDHWARWVELDGPQASGAPSSSAGAPSTGAPSTGTSPSAPGATPPSSKNSAHAASAASSCSIAGPM